MFNTSFENSKRALFREQKEDKHPTNPLFLNRLKKNRKRKIRKCGRLMTNTTSLLGVRESVLIPQRSPRMSPTRISGVSTAST